MKASLLLFAVFALGAAAPARQVDLSTVRGSLRKLITAEETYFVDHSAYTSNLSQLKLAASDSVTIKFVEFSPTAYAASGTLKGADGVSCVVMIGNVTAAPETAKGTAATAEGGVICDE